MKVLYVTGMYSAKYGGLEKFNIELLVSFQNWRID